MDYLQRGGTEEGVQRNYDISTCQPGVANWRESPAHDFFWFDEAIKMSSMMWTRVAGTVTIYLF